MKNQHDDAWSKALAAAAGAAPFTGDQDARILAAIRRDTAPPARRRQPWRRWLAQASFGIALFIAGYILGGNREPAGSPPSSLSAHAVQKSLVVNADDAGLGLDCLVLRPTHATGAVCADDASTGFPKFPSRT